ncbi:hypothetical protein [Ralstonia mannitolilytica]|uniref:hypothetical protein n=1 Tax=Ralstonia mannitolilytica TaxID=105219 RepID=UPI003748340F
MDSTTPSIEAVKALDGKMFAKLSEEEKQVLTFYRDRGRKYGVSIEIVGDVDAAELAQASREQADQILARANSRVTVAISDDRDDELQHVDEAKAIAAEFASHYAVDGDDARSYAVTWFQQGEGYPERKGSALVRALKRHFGLY